MKIKKNLNIFLIFLMLITIFLNPLTAEGAIKKDDVNDEIPAQYVPLYQKAAKKYGVSWFLLASIHNQETAFSANVSKSSAGAIGHAQFMRCTWVGWGYSGCQGTKGDSSNINDKVLMDLEVIKKHGGFGTDGNQDGKADPWDIVDGIYSMARYLGSAMSFSKTEDKNIRDAAFKYNHSDKYVDEVTKRYYRYKEGWKGTTLEGSDGLTGASADGLWGDDLGTVGSGNGDGNSSGESGGTGVYEHISKFKDYVINIKNVGVNLKKNHDNLYVDYKINKYVKYVLEVLYNVSFAFGIILLGYVNLLWLCILLARTRFEPAYKLVELMTQGKIDAFDDLGKAIKLSLFLVLFIAIAISGLMPLIFAFIYKFISAFLVLIFRI